MQMYKNFLVDFLLSVKALSSTRLIDQNLQQLKLIMSLSCQINQLVYQNSSYNMNPFEKLRKTIQNINIDYQFEQDQPQTTEPTNFYQTNPPQQPMRSTTISNQQQIQRIRTLCQNQQISNIKQITQQAAKLQQLQKSLKRAESVIENQMNDLVSLEKENQLLKSNLNQQYSSIVQNDEKQRKYKEEIYRINVTVNELAIQINSERNIKKQYLKQIQNLKEQLASTNKLFQQSKTQAQKQKQKILSQLEERIDMFEYNIKKNSQQRNQSKLNLSKLQQNYEKQLNDAKVVIDSLRQQLMQTKKSFEVEIIRKQNVQQALEREKKQNSQQKQFSKSISEQLQSLRQKYNTSLLNQDTLEKNMSQLGSELAQQKKNIKVKVIQIRDQTLVLQLEMYKRQCKQLMQEKAIMRNINTERSLEPQFTVINSEIK